MRTATNRVAACLVASCLMWPLAAGAAENATYVSKRDAARTEYEKRLFLLARTALQNGLGEAGMMFLREIVVRDPGHTKARDMAGKLDAYLAKHQNDTLTPAQQRAKQTRTKQLEALADRERQKYVRKVVTLAKWCKSQKYEDGLKESIAEGLALEYDNVTLRALKGQKKHALYGWFDTAIVDRLNAGEWIEDGQWKKWSGISARRIAEFKKGIGPLVGEGFHYTASYHFTVVTNLKDRSFEKDLIDSLETLVREQYREFYSDFRVGMKPYFVVYFQDKSEFSEFTRRTGGVKAAAMGYYSGKNRTLYSWRHDGTMTNGVGTVYHETTHATLHDYFGDKKLPIWFDEGLASFHEKSRPDDKGFRFGPINVPRMGELKKMLEGGKHISLADVFALEGTFGKNVMYSYNLSAMFIHFLYGKKLLKQFLNEMLTHGDADKAVLNVLGPDRTAWDKVFDTYVRGELLDAKAREKMYQQMRGTRLQ